MSMSVLILSLIFVESPAPPPILRDLCPKPTVTVDSAKFQRLTDLPRAEAFNAVWRSNKCPVTVIQARDRLGPVPKPRR